MKTRWIGLLVAAAFAIGALLVLGRPRPGEALASDEHLTDQFTCASGCNVLREVCCLEEE